jgi:DNA (cytosine-5)-methyltransferase 1
MKYNAIDLFCGCGGMSLGLEKAGYDVLYANDINIDALKTYKYNFPKVIVEHGDITKIDPHDVKKQLKGKKIHLITAGTPCQGFSMLGRRNPNDPRNKLFKQIIKFVKVIKPKMFVMENVSGLLSMDDGSAFDKIKNYFEEAGYHVKYKVLSAADFGVPQNRNRVFIVGTQKNIPEEKIFPRIKKNMPVTVKEAISDLAFLGIGKKSTKYMIKPKSSFQKMMRKKSPVLYNHESSRHSDVVQKRFAKIPSGKNGRNVLKNSGTKKRDYYRMHPNKTCRTITTIPEDFIHYEKNRIPTVREMARLQSFPDDFIFLGHKMTGGLRRRYDCPQYTQVANAVPPLLAKVVFKNIAKVLNH